MEGKIDNVLTEASLPREISSQKAVDTEIILISPSARSYFCERNVEKFKIWIINATAREITMRIDSPEKIQTRSLNL